MKGFKTIIYGAAVMGLAILSDDAAKAFVLEHFEWVGGAIGALIILLRTVTNSPVFKAADGSAEKKKHNLAALLGAGLLCALLAGCSHLDTDRKRYAAASGSYEGIVHALADLNAAGMLPPSKKGIVQETAVAANIGLNMWHAALIDRDKAKIDLWEREVLSLIRTLEKLYREMKYGGE